MKDGATKSCVAIAGIVAVYAIYSFNNPGADGLVFGSILAAVTGLGGYTLALQKKAS